MVSSRGCRRISAPALGAPLLALPPLTLVSAGLFLSFVPSCSVCLALFGLSYIYFDEGEATPASPDY